jgi:urea transport system substrate-binding protein
MSFSRRKFLAGTGTAGLAVMGATIPFELVLAQGSPIKLGSILDNSGNLDAYGKPMVMATTLAVEELNAAGGLLGRKIDLIQYDSQSNMALYTKYAQQLTRSDNVDVMHGGITSASREAVRQTLHRANTLYFYNVLYEGGVCDRNIVCTGTTPAQAAEPIVEVALKEWGNTAYILAADHCQPDYRHCFYCSEARS